MKLCVDCRYCTYRGPKPRRWWEFGVPHPLEHLDLIFARCGHPRMASLVDGSAEMLCDRARSAGYVCGPEAKLFDARED